MLRVNEFFLFGLRTQLGGLTTCIEEPDKAAEYNLFPVFVNKFVERSVEEFLNWAQFIFFFIGVIGGCLIFGSGLLFILLVILVELFIMMF